MRIRFSIKVYHSVVFKIFILGALRKFKINNNACTSFKIENIKLPLTIPHPRADLLPQMPHPGEDKVVKCPTNTRGGCTRLELTEPLAPRAKANGRTNHVITRGNHGRMVISAGNANFLVISHCARCKQLSLQEGPILFSALDSSFI